MATGTDPAADRHVSDHYALLGVRPDAYGRESYVYEVTATSR